MPTVQRRWSMIQNLQGFRSLKRNWTSTNMMSRHKLDRIQGPGLHKLQKTPWLGTWTTLTRNSHLRASLSIKADFWMINQNARLTQGLHLSPSNRPLNISRDTRSNQSLSLKPARSTIKQLKRHGFQSKKSQPSWSLLSLQRQCTSLLRCTLSINFRSHNLQFRIWAKLKCQRNPSPSLASPWKKSLQKRNGWDGTMKESMSRPTQQMSEVTSRTCHKWLRRIKKNLAKLRKKSQKLGG